MIVTGLLTEEQMKNLCERSSSEVIEKSLTSDRLLEEEEMDLDDLEELGELE